MSIVSNIIRQDINVLYHTLNDASITALGLPLPIKPDATDAEKTAFTSAFNRLVSNACSTREAGELVAVLGKSKGSLSATSLTARGEIEKTSKADGGVSPAWAWAVKVNKLASLHRRTFDLKLVVE